MLLTKQTSQQENILIDKNLIFHNFEYQLINNRINNQSINYQHSLNHHYLHRQNNNHHLHHHPPHNRHHRTSHRKDQYWCQTTGYRSAYVWYSILQWLMVWQYLLFWPLHSLLLLVSYKKNNVYNMHIMWFNVSIIHCKKHYYNIKISPKQTSH